MTEHKAGNQADGKISTAMAGVAEPLRALTDGQAADHLIWAQPIPIAAQKLVYKGGSGMRLNVLSCRCEVHRSA
jgi:hypothetical protein